ncbi:MAG: Ig-like domain-containing protein [Vicinamibacterales bacterium]
MVRRAFILVALAAAFGTAAAAGVRAQGSPPQATSVDALLAYPDYFHGRSVVIRGEVETEGARHRIRSSDGSRLLPAVFGNRSVPSGLTDIRGQLLDVGRLRPDDPRVAGYELERVLGLQADQWPRPGEALVLAVAGSLPAVRPAESAATLRAVALEPQRYEGRKLTLRGQYRGRNLFGEVPRAPGVGRFDFLIRSAGAGVWVTGIRPRGRGFQFDLDSKLDTERWLEVVGVVRHARGLVWVEAESVRLAEPGTETEPTPEAEVVVDQPPPPPPEAIFSIPTEGETEVPTDTTIRIQFSRDIDPSTIEDGIRIGYTGAPPSVSEPPPPITFTYTYNEGARALEIRFEKPLDRFRTVKVELTEAILGADKQPLKPWTLTFTVGG